MSELWLDITDIPAEGREFSFSDQAIWTGPVAEFSLGHVLDAPGLGLEASFSVLPQGRGALVRGRRMTSHTACSASASPSVTMPITGARRAR